MVIRGVAVAYAPNPHSSVDKEPPPADLVMWLLVVVVPFEQRGRGVLEADFGKSKPADLGARALNYKRTRFFGRRGHRLRTAKGDSRLVRNCDVNLSIAPFVCQRQSLLMYAGELGRSTTQARGQITSLLPAKAFFVHVNARAYPDDRSTIKVKQSTLGFSLLQVLLSEQ